MTATKDRLNPRQEAFALHVAMGLPLGEAYRQAGFRATGNHVYENATKLAKQTKVRSRIDQVQAKAEQHRLDAHKATLIVTAQSVGLMLAEAYEDAKANRQNGAQVAAAMGLAKLHGLLVDKTEDVTRRATRDPAAPVEIDVEHWVTEQSALLLGQSPAAGAGESPSDAAPSGEVGEISEPPDDMGLGAPEPSGLQSPETGLSE